MKDQANQSAEASVAVDRNAWCAPIIVGLLVAGTLATLAATVSGWERRQAQIASARYEETLAAIRSAERATEAVLERLEAEIESRSAFDAALDPIAGPGVRITVDDSRAEQGTVLHDEDLLLLVNELCAADAEAIAINDVRLHATSSIRCTGPTIRVNGTALGAPYIVEAIGDPATLAAALRLPRGIASELRAVSIDVEVETIDALELPAASFVPLRKGRLLPRPNKE